MWNSQKAVIILLKKLTAGIADSSPNPQKLVHFPLLWCRMDRVLLLTLSKNLSKIKLNVELDLSSAISILRYSRYLRQIAATANIKPLSEPHST